MTTAARPAPPSVHPAPGASGRPARDAGGARVPARGGRRSTALVVAGVAILVASLLAAVVIGPADLTVPEVWAAVRHHLGLGDAPTSALRDAIVWQGRLPRALVAACVGAGLALCGAVMQSLTRNPLADPYLLGLSSGASLGAVAVLLLGVNLLLPVAAFAGSLLALVAALALAGSLGAITPTRTVLAGLAVGQLCAAVTSFVIFWTATGDSYREVLSWLMGSVAGATWTSVAIAGGALVLLGLPLAAAGNVLDAFTFGDASAATLGLPVARTRWLLLGAVALLTGALVSVSGSIGFVGLVLPHAVKALTGPRHRVVLPVAALAGATFLVWADTLARTVLDPREIPVGVVTAAVGAPVFALLLWRGRKVIS